MFWPLFVPEAKNMLRWRVRLECGCTHEVFTHGEDEFPDDRSHLDPITRCRLPAGEYWCPSDLPRCPTATSSSGLTGKSRSSQPDAEEPDYDWMDAETWAKIRKPRPHSSAFWKVKLDCGHHQQVCTDVDWKPEMSPSCCPRSASRRSAVISRRVGRPRGTLAGHTRAPSATTSGR